MKGGEVTGSRGSGSYGEKFRSAGLVPRNKKGGKDV